MALVYDLADTQELLGYVRGIQQEQDRNRFVLSQFLPNRNIDDIEYRVTKGALRDQDAATVRAWDTESPIGNRQGLERLAGELPPISKKIRLGEEERLRKRALETGSTAQIIAAIYDDAANLARSVAARIELLRGEALYAGSITLNENGVVATVDFGRPAEMEVAPATLWSDPTATPVEDEMAWWTAYRDLNGIDPQVALTSSEVITNLSLNEQYRGFAAVQGITPAFLSINQINQIRGAYNLPTLVAYDTKIRVDGTQQRVIPADRVIYLPPAGEPLGSTFFGTTAEALELQGARQITADQAIGMVATVAKTDDPVATWTKVAAISFPVLVNPELSMVADVL